MNYQVFKEEMSKLMKGFKTEDNMKALDSMAITEACILCEEHLNVAIPFGKMRTFETIHQLTFYLSEQGVKVD